MSQRLASKYKVSTYEGRGWARYIKHFKVLSLSLGTRVLETERLHFSLRSLRSHKSNIMIHVLKQCVAQTPYIASFCIAGYIQTPDLGNTPSPRGMNSTVYVDMPHDHNVMVTVVEVLLREHAQLTVRTSLNSVWTFDRRNIDMAIARLLHWWKGGHMVVSYLDCVTCPQSTLFTHRDGFKLRFTFHPVNRSRPLVADVLSGLRNVTPKYSVYTQGRLQIALHISSGK